MEGWPAACTWERGALAAVGRHFWGGGIFSVKGFSLGKLLGREGSLLVPGIFESEGWRVRENFREIFQLRLWLHFWRERAFLCRGEGFLVFLEKGSSSGKKGQRVFFLRVGCIFGCHFWEILEGVKKDRGGLSWVRVFFSISGFKDILEGFDREDGLLTDLGGYFESRVWENQGANKEVSFPFLSLHPLLLRRAATDLWMMHCFYSS